MRVYRVKDPVGGASFTEKDITVVAEYLRNADEGSAYLVIVMEMDEATYNALPEFSGF